MSNRRPAPLVDPGEVQLSAIRAQGAGGQNVNKVSSAIHLRFDVAASSLPERLKERLQTSPAHSLDELVEKLAGRLGAAPAGERLRWIKASVGTNVRLIPVEEVLFFQSDEKYTRVVCADSEVLIRKPIKELLDELDPDKFWQVHRATIVNVDHIASVRMVIGADCVAKLVQNCG